MTFFEEDIGRKRHTFVYSSIYSSVIVTNVIRCIVQCIYYKNCYRASSIEDRPTTLPSLLNLTLTLDLWP